jgi:hypothetical protein
MQFAYCAHFNAKQHSQKGERATTKQVEVEGRSGVFYIDSEKECASTVRPGVTADAASGAGAQMP